MKFTASLGADHLKAALINLAKILFASLLIYYLMDTGQLDFSQLSKVLTVPSLGLGIVAYWLMGPVLLGSLRWSLLMAGCGYHLPWLEAMRLQLIGLFFNTAMPGAVGGDLVKAMYAIKDQKGKSKTPVIMSIFLDRLLGLYGLFILGLVAGLANLPLVLQQPALSSIVAAIAITCLGIALFLLAALHSYQGKDPFDAFLARPVVGFKQIRGIYQSLRVYRHRKMVILKCLGISVLIQLIGVGVFCLFTLAIIPEESPKVLTLMSLFPIGMFTVALPIAPGGLGVGHMAFDRLFSMVSYSQGATVFNAFLLSTLVLNLLGAIPYLGLRKKVPSVDMSPL